MKYTMNHIVCASYNFIIVRQIEISDEEMDIIDCINFIIGLLSP